MRRAIAAIHDFATSLAGRIALILAVGTSLAAIAALLVSEQGRRYDFMRIQAERVVASALDVIDHLEHDQTESTFRLRTGKVTGAALVGAQEHIVQQLDPMLSAMLAKRLDPSVKTRISHVAPSVCTSRDPFWRRPRAAGFHLMSLPDCWLVTLERPSGRTLIAIDLPHLPTPPSSATDPVVVLLITLSATILSLLVARLATAPLRQLSAASEAFAQSIDAQPVAEKGPRDVADALATFNIMQDRVRDGVRERSRLLAAISHDLQTPLTRLRLRLEHVEDEALRDRLVTDLSATLRMVKRGLELARSGESAEDWTVVDLDSLLGSIADDASEVGQPVSFRRGCGARARVKLDALARCIGNLVDNAVKYGGNAELACDHAGSTIAITVRDTGPGIEPALLTRVMEPFVRGEPGNSSANGTGIGLTIARAQAAVIGGVLTLRNHPDGGVEAMLALRPA